ncbi:hypothetical protein [Natronorubrum halophilum]|uniref:hypothetical protein n=1 Tax=Natronorubrum halophilum TaxID=1702106 RepID=UPI0010C1C5A6|nr:hypothetical protein [Natronorubrum halophilum]
MLTSPSTTAQQKRYGYLLVGTGIVLAIAFTVRNVIAGDPWTRLLGVFLVTGVLVAVGLRGVILARRGTHLLDERTRRSHYRAGYVAFIVLFVVIGSDATVDMLGANAAAIYLWTGLLAYLGSLEYHGRTASD